MTGYGETYYAGMYDDACLMHYGVKGMKWGVRRRSEAYTTARANYKSAKKDYNKAARVYNRGSRHANRLSAKRRARNHARYNDMLQKADRFTKAEREYKQVKKAERNTPEAKARRRRLAAGVAGAAGAAAVGAAAYKAYKRGKTPRLTGPTQMALPGTKMKKVAKNVYQEVEVGRNMAGGGVKAILKRRKR